MIELRNVSKTFTTDKGEINAVKDATIKIENAEIFGFIGYSGAGKSTIVRCINLLERPSSGDVIINGINLTKLNAKDLRKQRNNIGMIFQQFNLLSSLTVAKNIELNIRKNKLSKKEKEQRVDELLNLVGIKDKKNSYPSELSGGQKQRVAIARALANNPDILLCDEATSALDPQTTSQILSLLKDLNKELKITIVIITHEMDVIKNICDRVAVDSVFFIFYNNNQKISVLTDTGTVNQTIIDSIRDSNVLLLESNHDIDMLEKGPYPIELKYRIKSEKGHLSNEASSLIVRDIVKGTGEHIILGHLSKTNNTEKIAFENMSNTLTNLGLNLKKDIVLDVAKEFEVGKIKDLGGNYK